MSKLFLSASLPTSSPPNPPTARPLVTRSSTHFIARPLLSQLIHPPHIFPPPPFLPHQSAYLLVSKQICPFFQPRPGPPAAPTHLPIYQGRPLPLPPWRTSSASSPAKPAAHRLPLHSRNFETTPARIFIRSRISSRKNAQNSTPASATIEIA